MRNILGTVPGFWLLLVATLCAVGHAETHYYIFDIDENVLNLGGTKLHLFEVDPDQAERTETLAGGTKFTYRPQKVDGKIVSISTDEYARYKDFIGRPEAEIRRLAKEQKIEVTDEILGLSRFEFRPTQALAGDPTHPDGKMRYGSMREIKSIEPGKNYFLAAVKRAWESGNFRGPMWSRFEELLRDPVRSQQIYLLTARGHSQEDIQAGIEFLKEKLGIKTPGPPKGNFIAVGDQSKPDFRSMENPFQQPSELKRDALKKYILDRAEKEGGEVHFSDDDFKNFDTVRKFLTEERAAGRLSKIRFVLAFTGKRHAEEKPHALVFERFEGESTPPARFSIPAASPLQSAGTLDITRVPTPETLGKTIGHLKTALKKLDVSLSEMADPHRGRDPSPKARNNPSSQFSPRNEKDTPIGKDAKVVGPLRDAQKAIKDFLKALDGGRPSEARVQELLAEAWNKLIHLEGSVREKYRDALDLETAPLREKETLEERIHEVWKVENALNNLRATLAGAWNEETRRAESAEHANSIGVREYALRSVARSAKIAGLKKSAASPKEVAKELAKLHEDSLKDLVSNLKANGEPLDALLVKFAEGKATLTELLEAVAAGKVKSGRAGAQLLALKEAVELSGKANLTAQDLSDPLDYAQLQGLSRNRVLGKAARGDKVIIGVLGDSHGDFKKVLREAARRVKAMGATHVEIVGDLIDFPGTMKDYDALRIITEETGVPAENIGIVYGNWEVENLGTIGLSENAAKWREILKFPNKTGIQKLGEGKTLKELTEEDFEGVTLEELKARLKNAETDKEMNSGKVKINWARSYRILFEHPEFKEGYRRAIEATERVSERYGRLVTAPGDYGGQGTETVRYGARGSLTTTVGHFPNQEVFERYLGPIFPISQQLNVRETMRGRGPDGQPIPGSNGRTIDPNARIVIYAHTHYPAVYVGVDPQGKAVIFLNVGALTDRRDPFKTSKSYGIISPEQGMTFYIHSFDNEKSDEVTARTERSERTERIHYGDISLDALLHFMKAFKHDGRLARLGDREQKIFERTLERLEGAAAFATGAPGLSG